MKDKRQGMVKAFTCNLKAVSANALISTTCAASSSSVLISLLVSVIILSFESAEISSVWSYEKGGYEINYLNIIKYHGMI